MKSGTFALFLILGMLLFGAVLPAAAADDGTLTDNATIYYNAAEMALGNGNYTTAIGLYDLALAENTTQIRLNDALLYTYRDKAYAQIQLGNYSEAIVTLDTGIQEYPNDEMIWNNKGYAQYKLGQYRDAVTSYDKALSINGNYTTALINKGNAHLILGNTNDAIASYKAALASDPGNSVATTKLAQAEKQAAAEQSQILMILAVLVIVAIIAVAWYVTRKNAGKKDTDDGKKPDSKKKVNKKK
ncbi:MAG: tetratricopeptide repeat protein [Methanoregula sp.]|jgi:tetratricopeptide (TPR) repeat protein